MLIIRVGLMYQIYLPLVTWLESPELVVDPPEWFPECGVLEALENDESIEDFRNPYGD